jgi:lipopolysaccharide export system permease protein
VNILSRYVASSLVRGWLMVLLVLAAVFGLIGFIQELERTRFDYDALAVARYSLLILPQQLMSLAPVIALLGSIVALANLDKSNELTIISCSGVPLRQLLKAVAIPTLLLMGLLWLGMEYVTAPLHQQAEQQRHALRFRNDVRIPDGGVWSRQGQRYIHLEKMHPGGIPGDISLFEFNQQGELLLAIHAQSAEVNRDRRWLFKQVRKKELVDGELHTSRLEELGISNLWAPEELPTLTLSSDSMTLTVLYNYSQYLISHNQSANRYLSAFWQKLAMPLTVAAMVLLATPISANLGSRRDRNFGANMAIGALLGILFYLGAQVIFALGQLLELSFGLIAVTPAIIVFACALFMLGRMRW